MKRWVTAALSALVLSTCLTGQALAAGTRLTIKGSDTLLPLASAWAEEYMNRHPKVSISVTGGGSGAGFAALINGSCDIADASREAKPKEISKARDRNIALKATPVAKDGIAVIVHPDNPIKGLTMTQLGKLYSGARTWSEVGGSKAKVVAVGRDSSSGTYVFFQDTVLGGRKYRQDMLTLPSNTAICQTVSQDDSAVGYVGLAFAKDAAAKGKIRIIAVNGTAASDESVKSGKYPLWRYLYNYTDGTPRGVAADYLKFVSSPDGQKIVERTGYVSK